MKTIPGFIATLFFLFIFGCQDKQAMEKLEELEAQISLEEQNKALVMKVFESYNNKTVENFDVLFDTSFKYYTFSISKDPLSLEQSNNDMKTLFTAFPDCQWTVKEVFSDGDRVMVWTVFNGTHEADWLGIAATGNKIEVSGYSLYRIKNGKIVEEREESNGLGGMEQLGMEFIKKE